jgi:glycosyltransferase involved in cell wall biosynthesis
MPNDIYDLKNKILTLWNNPILALKMGENARKYVEEHFNPENHYKKLTSMYKQAINKNKPS